jgi:hypothetical protein
MEKCDKPNAFMHTMDEVMRTKEFRILSKMTPKGDIVSQAQ